MLKSALALLSALLLVQLAAAGHDQWVDLYITNMGAKPMKLTGVTEWGHFYDNGDRWSSIEAPEFTLRQGETGRYSATGKAYSPTGTYGSVYGEIDGKRVVRFEFNCPPMSQNLFAVHSYSDSISVTNTPWTSWKALGEIKAKVYQH